MKRILLFLTILTIGIVSVSAEKGTKNKEGNSKEALYKEAVEALEQQRFVATFHAGEWGSSRRIDLDGRRNFLIIDGQKGFFQTSVDEDFSKGYMTGGVGLTPLKMLESDVVKAEKKCDKKGNITYTVLLNSGRVVGVKNAKEAKITLKKGSNDVMVKIKYKGGDRGRRAGSSVYTGSLHPIGAVAIERGILYP